MSGMFCRRHAWMACCIPPPSAICVCAVCCVLCAVLCARVCAVWSVDWSAVDNRRLASGVAYVLWVVPASWDLGWRSGGLAATRRGCLMQCCDAIDAWRSRRGEKEPRKGPYTA
ncbi:hypothetical protein B0T25DRAFT_200676 [Lasiosphaeria hispida]|uniref:Secreted protein n=1 Tax=Lasiosphaeria hispida TaxID=260671 RepID=A0AAJ0HII5_9PEZI|nr:hypothetical protein B0T25DRAFT_200676 [Lasiosphaeria hispida]